ncbi:MAG: sporulation initiation factor Spo0A C-terminal domain-containing protein [Christensenellales bacterium]|jgi:two-component system response regulator (stage 0 sporulation protein A)
MRERVLTAVIADISPDSAARTEIMLAEAGVRALAKVSDGRAALREALALRPDALIADAVMPALDGAGLAQRLMRAQLNVRPAVIIAAYAGMAHMPRIDAPSVAMIEKPIRPQALRAALTETRVEMREITPAARRCVHRILDRLGVPEHLGRDFLEDAAYLAYHDARLTSKLTKALYPMVAKRFCVPTSAVERAMRHVIESAWASGNIEEQYGIFKGTIDAARGKPTCGGMIAQLADMLRMEDGI